MVDDRNGGDLGFGKNGSQSEEQTFAVIWRIKKESILILLLCLEWGEE